MQNWPVYQSVDEMVDEGNGTGMNPMLTISVGSLAPVNWVTCIPT